MKIWATLHAILHNPVVAAKMIATLDHISGGRAGLNIVAGAYRGEFEQMDAWDEKLDHDARYDLTEEWTDIVKRLWTEKPAWISRANISPSRIASASPSRSSRPSLICAGMSERGFDFSVRHADACFIGGRDVAETRAAAQRAKDLAAKPGQDHQDLCHVHRDLRRQRCGGGKNRAPLPRRPGRGRGAGHAGKLWRHLSWQRQCHGGARQRALS